MKYISAILSIYILALALLPCADQIDWCNSDTGAEQVVAQAEAGDHDHSSDSKDLCSPLCTCSCCHLTVRTPTKNDLPITIPKFIFADSPLLESVLVDITSIHDIWHPPQLS
jgi:hypothetical protein